MSKSRKVDNSRSRSRYDLKTSSRGRNQLYLPENEDFLLSMVMGQNLLNSISEHTRYQCEMSNWKKFILWTYTMDSSTITKFLLSDSNDLNSLEDIDLMVKWFHQFLTRSNQQSIDLEISPRFDSFRKFFEM